MNVLGINHSLDAAAALLEGGRVVAAAAEERFVRQKHYAGFPRQALAFCLRQGGIDLAEVEEVAFFWNPALHLAEAPRAMGSDFRHHSEFLLHLPRELLQLYPAAQPLEVMEQRLQLAGRARPLILSFVEHHLCHAASAFFCSPFEEAAILSLDGYGEKTSTQLARGEGEKIYPLEKIEFPHSLGSLYAAITEYLGFRPNSGEGKVMGLASWGRPVYLDAFRQLLHLDEGGLFSLDLRYFQYYLERGCRYSPLLVELLGPARHSKEPLEERHQDIAASLQQVVEEAILSLGRRLYRQTGQKKCCLAGGVALNCVANTRLLEEGPFEEIFCQPAAGDAGSSLGAALYVSHHLRGLPRRAPLEHDYLGPSWTEEECKEILLRWGLPFERPQDIATAAAEELVKGSFVGWFQGRAEFGPRALGHRSIVADPRGAEVQEQLNHRVKFREPFRPFAPAVLEEERQRYFSGNRPSPFMLFVAQTLPPYHPLLPAVTHIDGSARLQTVSAKTNPLFHRLISEFGRLSGIPLVLNTSLNIRGEPIANSPRDALLCFCTSGLDLLALGPFLVRKNKV